MPRCLHAGQKSQMGEKRMAKARTNAAVVSSNLRFMLATPRSVRLFSEFAAECLALALYGNRKQPT